MELAGLGLVQVNGAGCCFLLVHRGHGPGHLIVRLLVARRGAKGSCRAAAAEGERERKTISAQKESEGAETREEQKPARCSDLAMHFIKRLYPTPCGVRASRSGPGEGGRQPSDRRCNLGVAFPPCPAQPSPVRARLSVCVRARAAAGWQQARERGAQTWPGARAGSSSE